MGHGWKVGDRIAGRWLVEEVLRGGMGDVYIVLDPDTQERLAAKTYRDDILLGNKSSFVHRFEREALTWIRLAPHPGVVAARFVSRSRGRPLLFLEYVAGGTLKGLLPELCPRYRFDPRLRRVRQLALEFCAAMSHAALHGVAAHRDIKPENCLLTGGREPRLKVTDFGLVRALDEAEDEPIAVSVDSAVDGGVVPLGPTLFRTRTGTAAGTPSHMPPEQFLDLKRAGVRSDVYSFGVMLFQMLVGRLPFPGPSLREFFEQHSSAPPPPLPPSARGFSEVVARCLEKDPERRFAGFTEVAIALADSAPNLRTCYDDGPDLRACDVPWLEATGATPEPIPESAPRSGLARLAGRVHKVVTLDRIEEGPRAGLIELELEDDPAALLQLATVKIRAGWEHAQALIRSGDRDSALAALDSLTAAFPGFGRAWAEMGILLMDAPGRCDAALSCLEKARRLGEQGLEKDIGRCRTTLAAELVAKARSFKHLSRTELAFDALRQATRAFPESGRAWGELGVLLLETGGDRAEASRCLEAARRLGERGQDDRIAQCLSS